MRGPSSKSCSWSAPGGHLPEGPRSEGEAFLLAINRPEGYSTPSGNQPCSTTHATATVEGGPGSTPQSFPSIESPSRLPRSRRGCTTRPTAKTRSTTTTCRGAGCVVAPSSPWHASLAQCVEGQPLAAANQRLTLRGYLKPQRLWRVCTFQGVMSLESPLYPPEKSRSCAMQQIYLPVCLEGFRRADMRIGPPTHRVLCAFPSRPRASLPCAPEPRRQGRQEARAGGGWCCPVVSLPVARTREAEQPNNGQVGLTACSSSPPRTRRARW